MENAPCLAPYVLYMVHRTNCKHSIARESSQTRRRHVYNGPISRHEIVKGSRLGNTGRVPATTTSAHAYARKHLSLRLALDDDSLESKQHPEDLTFNYEPDGGYVTSGVCDHVCAVHLRTAASQSTPLHLAVLFHGHSSPRPPCIFHRNGPAGRNWTMQPHA
jgi:hypothetical protein